MSKQSWPLAVPTHLNCKIYYLDEPVSEQPCPRNRQYQPEG